MEKYFHQGLGGRISKFAGHVWRNRMVVFFLAIEKHQKDGALLTIQFEYVLIGLYLATFLGIGWGSRFTFLGDHRADSLEKICQVMRLRSRQQPPVGLDGLIKQILIHGDMNQSKLSKNDEIVWFEHEIVWGEGYYSIRT